MKYLTTEDLYRQFSLEHFRELATFGALSNQTIMNLLESGTLFELNDKEVLYNTDDKVEEFYVVLSGSIALFHSYHSIPALIHCYGPGQQIGFVGMIALHNRKGQAIAQQNSHILAISTRQFFDLQQTSPEDFGLLMINLSREMARTIGELGDLIAEIKSHT